MAEANIPCNSIASSGCNIQNLAQYCPIMAYTWDYIGIVANCF